MEKELNNSRKSLEINGKTYQYYNILESGKEKVKRLPFSIRILLESTLRKQDNFVVKPKHVESILNWGLTKEKQEIPFFPSRVLLQDYTGVPAVVDLASLREAIFKIDPSKVQKITPEVPVELVIDHSIQVDKYASKDSISFNEEKEFQRNKERFKLLKWGQKAFEKMKIVPPGSGIVHQVNLESLARVVFNNNNLLYPDSLVGTDSHTTMINGLGVLGWGVGGIEAEAVMLGEYVSMLLPDVVGVRVVGKLKEGCCATDVVLKLVNKLRKVGVVGKFVEFHGEGLQCLSLADRATLSNMAPEYGATMGFFPVDDNTLDYLRLTGRTDEMISIIEHYLKNNFLFRNEETEGSVDYTQLVELDLNEVTPVVAGPKRPQDMIEITGLKDNFDNCLTAPRGFNGFAMKEDSLKKEIKTDKFTLKNGSLLIAAITSCTNTSNPFVLMAAGLLAKKAIENGLTVPDYVKTSLSPGSKVVTQFLQSSGLYEYLDKLGFTLVGYGCMTCIGNSGDLRDDILKIVEENLDMTFTSALSGNRNFEGRIHPYTKANYLCSPIFVVAFALAGRINIDFENESLGKNSEGKEIFLKDIFPSNKEINEYVNKFITPKMYRDNYAKILEGNEKWKSLKIEGSGDRYKFEQDSTYIKNPPYFDNFKFENEPLKPLKNLNCLLLLGDTITTDHISPAGKIARKSATAKYLKAHNIKNKDFNSYGSRRGNHEVMVRGTFSNVRIRNKLCPQIEGPYTVLEKGGDPLFVFDGAEKMGFDNLIVIAGKEYGTGSSRDWAGKGPALMGVRVVIAESYERIHRSNLVGMGVLPLEFLEGESAQGFGLTGFEKFSMDLRDLSVKGTVKVQTDTGVSFETNVRIDTDPEMNYYRSGGILVYVLKRILKE